MVIEISEQLSNMIKRCHIEGVKIKDDGLEFYSNDQEIKLLVFATDEDSSYECFIDRSTLESICSRNGMELWEVDKEDDLLNDFYKFHASRYERECVEKECLEVLINQVMGVKVEATIWAS